MIKLWLKHKLTEMALNAFFRKLSQNFDNFDAEYFYVGRRFELINTIKYQSKDSYPMDGIDTIYYNAEIIQINNDHLVITAHDVEREFFSINSNYEIIETSELPYTGSNVISIYIGDITNIYDEHGMELDTLNKMIAMRIK